MGACTSHASPGEDLFDNDELFLRVCRRAARPQSSAGSKVLVVDDNPVVNQEMCEHVRSAGLDPVSARDGSEALHLFRGNRGEVRCVMMDLCMPQVDGYRATVSILEEAGDQSPPIFGMVSGEPRAFEEKRCYDLGFTCVIPKPSSPRHVLRIVSQT